jgi:hypothetical protein
MNRQPHSATPGEDDEKGHENEKEIRQLLEKTEGGGCVRERGWH